MEGLDLVLLLLAVVAAVTLLAQKVRIPYPILMVVAGPGIALIPAVPTVELDPDTVLTVFLPPILFSGAFFLSVRDLWRNIRPIFLLAVGLVITTTIAVAVVAVALVPELGWPMAVALGADRLPTDAIAATSVARRLNLPRRLVIIFEGESLVNDATALTVYRLAVIAAVGTTAGPGTLDLGEAAVSFVVIAAGGAIFGLVIGWGAAKLVDLIDDPPVEILVSLLAPFAAFIPAEQFGFSGVLAVVTAGLLVGYRAPHILRVKRQGARRIGVADADLRRERPRLPARRPAAADGAGEPRGLRRRPTDRPGGGGLLHGHRGAPAVGVSGDVPAPLAHSLARPPRPGAAAAGDAHPRLGRHARRAHARRRAGSAPGDRDREPLPGRGLVIFLAFSVILATLIGQGLTLGPLIRRLGVVDDGSLAHEELHAREVATAAALVRIEEMRAEVPGHLPLLTS
jgi:CPA1 family monovalent cation:H+ antiporter